MGNLILPMKKGVRIVIWSILALITVLLDAGTLVLYSRTLIPLWQPIAATAVLAIASCVVFAPKWQPLTMTSSHIVNWAVNLVFAGSIIAFSFFAINYWGADKSTERIVDAAIERRYSKQHTRYRRGRHGYTRPDGHYYTYHLELAFSDGYIKDRQVSLDQYNRMRRAHTVKCHLCDGLLGYPVIISY